MALAQVTQHPEVFVTWGSTFPDKIKLRKLVGIWPLRLKLRADYCRVSRSFEYGCSCKARCGGSITQDLSATCNAQANMPEPANSQATQCHTCASLLWQASLTKLGHDMEA